MNNKIDTFVSTPSEIEYGFDKETERHWVLIHTLDLFNNKEYTSYVTCAGIDVRELSIIGFTIEFLGEDNNNIEVRYNSEMFEEIYNKSFDTFFKIMEENSSAM